MSSTPRPARAEGVGGRRGAGKGSAPSGLSDEEVFPGSLFRKELPDACEQATQSAARRPCGP